MKWKLLRVLLTISMFMEAAFSPWAHAQMQYGYGYPTATCPYEVTSSSAVSGIDTEIDSTNQQIADAKTNFRQAQRDLRDLDKKLENYEGAIQDVVDPSIYDRVMEHMRKHYDCCSPFQIQPDGTVSENYFLEVLDESYAFNYPAAFEQSEELQTPVKPLQMRTNSLLAEERQSQARMPACGPTDCTCQAKVNPSCCVGHEGDPAYTGCGTKKKKKAAKPAAPAAAPETPEKATETAQAPVVPDIPKAPPAPVTPDAIPITGGCPTTPCPQQSAAPTQPLVPAQPRPGSFDCKPNQPDSLEQQACKEQNDFPMGNVSRGTGPNRSHCAEDPRYRTNRFLNICQSGGQIVHEVCTDPRYQKSGVDKRDVRKCSDAIKKYAKTLRDKEKKEKEADSLDQDISDLRDHLADLKKDRSETLADEKALEGCAGCKELAARRRVAGPSGVQMGLTALAASLGGYFAYRGAQQISQQNTEAGWPTSPYLAAGSIYPFVMGGIGGIMGGVNGGYGCGGTIAGGGYGQGPFGQFGPNGAMGMYPQMGAGGAFGYPPGFGYPQMGGGMFNPGMGPWGQAGLGFGGGLGFGNPYAGGGFNPYGGGGFGPGFGGGIGAGFGMNPFGGGGFNPYGGGFGPGFGGGFGAGLGGGFNPFGGYSPYGGGIMNPYGLGGLGGGLGGGFGGIGAGFGGGLGINPQLYQQQLQYQIQQQQSALQRYQTEAALVQQMNAISNQLRMLDMSSSGGGGYSPYGGGIDIGISAGIGGYSPVGTTPASFPTSGSSSRSR